MRVITQKCRNLWRGHSFGMSSRSPSGRQTIISTIHLSQNESRPLIFSPRLYLFIVMLPSANIITLLCILIGKKDQYSSGYRNKRLRDGINYKRLIGFFQNVPRHHQLFGNRLMFFGSQLWLGHRLIVRSIKNRPVDSNP